MQRSALYIDARLAELYAQAWWTAEDHTAIDDPAMPGVDIAPPPRDSFRMCNRYRMSASRVEMLARFGVHVVPEPDRDVPGELFPKRWAWTVRDTAEGRVLEPMQWGFPPPAVARAPVTNVRNLASPFWRTALGRADRRCLVPVTSFCEWEGEKGSKTARWFDVPSRPIFAFAGIWRPTEIGPAMAFLTCEPNSLVAPVHPKAMPVVLDDDGEAAWLRGDDAAALAQPFPAQLMTMV